MDVSNLGPAKTYILRGKKGLRKGELRARNGNRWARKGNRGPCNRNRTPFNCTQPLLIAPVPVTVLVVGLRAGL